MADTSLWVNENDVLHSPLLSEKMRFAAQPMLRFRRFVDVKPAFGKGNGDTFNWDKTADVANPGGKLVETNTFHQTSQTPTKGTLTVYEYGNSIPYTFKMSALSSFDIEKIVKKGLADDMAKITDASAERKFDSCKLRYVGTATDGSVVTTTGAATATNSSALNEYHIRKMRLQLETRNVPEIAGGLVGIFALEAIESLMGAEKSTNQYTETGYAKIVEGEIGILNGVRLVKDNNATRYDYDLDDRTKTSSAYVNLLAGNGYIFGADTVVEAVAVPEEVRAKEVTDYGRSRGLAWYTIMGHEIVWDTAADCRIIKFDSAA